MHVGKELLYLTPMQLSGKKKKNVNLQLSKIYFLKMHYNFVTI